MNEQQVREEIQKIEKGDWLPVGESIVHHNLDGTYSVTDQNEQVDAKTIEGAIRFVLENEE